MENSMPKTEQMQHSFQEPVSKLGSFGMSILIVEDDFNSRQGLKLSLLAEGYRVDAVQDGLQAIKTVLERRFAVAIVDINLPNILDVTISGWDLVRIFRSIDPTMSIIIVSGEDGIEGQARQSDVTFLRKPIMPSQLKSMIKGLPSYERNPSTAS